jgi:hypothetical protein
VSSIRLAARRLSDVAEITLAFPDTSLRLFVKAHRKPGSPVERVRAKAQLEFDMLRQLHERFSTTPGYDVVRPIAFFPGEMVVVTEAARGENLHGLIKRQARGWPPAGRIDALRARCRMAGVWLRHFQAFTRVERTASLPADGIMEQLHADLRACVAAGLRPAVAQRLAEFCADQLESDGARRFPVVGEHPDYTPDNVLCSSDSVTVLDFTSFRLGCASSDVARFLAALAFLGKNPLYRPATIRTLADAFLGGYGWQDLGPTPGWRAYLGRYMVQAVRTATTWPYPAPLRRLVSLRAVMFLSAWTRRFTTADDGPALAVLA